MLTSVNNDSREAQLGKLQLPCPEQWMHKLTHPASVQYKCRTVTNQPKPVIPSVDGDTSTRRMSLRRVFQFSEA